MESKDKFIHIENITTLDTGNGVAVRVWINKESIGIGVITSNFIKTVKDDFYAKDFIASDITSDSAYLIKEIYNGELDGIEQLSVGRKIAQRFLDM